MAGAYNGSYYKGDIMTIEEAIEDLERRKRVMQPEMIAGIAKVFGVDPSELEAKA